MSVEHMSWAFRQSIDNPGMKFVLVTLANFSDGDGMCFPGQKRLARMTGQGERTVRRHLDALEEQGYLSRKERRREDGSRTSDLYELACGTTPVATGQIGRPPRPDLQGSPAKLAGHEPSVEPSDQDQKRTSPEATRSPGSSSAREKISKAQVEKIIEIWNENCGALPSVKNISNARERKLRVMIKQLGFDEARETMEKAARAVASDDFWLSKKYGLDNLLAGEKYVQKAESYDASGAGSQQTEEDLSVGDVVKFGVKRGQMRLVMKGKIARFEGHEGGRQVIVLADDGDEYRMSSSQIQWVSP